MPRKSKLILPDNQKYCPRCKRVLSIEDFSGGYCLDCSREYMNAYRNRAKWEEERELKSAAIAVYGGCTCGETDPDVLRIEPGGNDQLRILQQVSGRGFPDGYYMSCHNCYARTHRRT